MPVFDVRRLGFPLLFALLGTTSSCTFTLDLERFHHSGQPTTIDGVTFSDFRFTGKNMRSHLSEYFELLVVDRTNLIQAKAAYSGVTAEDFSFYLRGAVPKMNPPYRIDFWADHNMSGGYDGIVGGINEKDHAWRRVLVDPLPEDVHVVGSRYELIFQHDTAFVDILTNLEGNPISSKETLLPCQLTVVGADAFAGKMMEIRVVDQATGRLTGFFRKGQVTPTFPAVLTGILDEETSYAITAYVDDNANEKYDAGIDPSWSTKAISSDKGVVMNLDLANLPRAPIETGQP